MKLCLGSTDFGGDLLTWILSKTTSCLDARFRAKAKGDFDSSTFRSFPMSAFLGYQTCSSALQLSAISYPHLSAAARNLVQSKTAHPDNLTQLCWKLRFDTVSPSGIFSVKSTFQTAHEIRKELLELGG